jgi:hypothetical protein
MLAPDAFSGGDRVPCTGVAIWLDDVVEGGCGEPCSFVMHSQRIWELDDEEAQS